MTSIKTCISIFATFLVLAATMMAPAGAVSKAEKIAFTNAEKEWLAAHSKIVVGGPIALVENGDIIFIDIPKRGLNIVGIKDRQMSSEEVRSLLTARKKQWNPPSLGHPPGVLKRYTDRAVSAMKGAYLE